MAGASGVARAVRWMERFAAVVLLVLMAVVLVDVGGRSLFNRPLPWGTELVEMLLALMIFALYPVLAARGNHITVDLISVRPALQRVQRALSSLLGAALFAVVAWCVGRQGLRAAEFGESTALLRVPIAWILWGLSLGAAAAVLAFCASFIGVLARQAAPGAADTGHAASPPVLE